MLTKAQIQEWQTSKVTQDFITALKSDRDNILDNWASGQYTAETSEGTAQLNASALGQVRALDDVIVAFMTFHEEAEDA